MGDWKICSLMWCLSSSASIIRPASGFATAYWGWWMSLLTEGRRQKVTVLQVFTQQTLRLLRLSDTIKRQPFHALENSLNGWAKRCGFECDFGTWHNVIHLEWLAVAGILISKTAGQGSNLTFKAVSLFRSLLKDKSCQFDESQQRWLKSLLFNVLFYKSQCLFSIYCHVSFSLSHPYYCSQSGDFTMVLC